MTRRVTSTASVEVACGTAAGATDTSRMWRACAFSIVQAAPTERNLRLRRRLRKTKRRKIALEKVPSGSIKSVEIENEKVHLVWSFDISKAGTRNITEVLVGEDRKDRKHFQGEPCAAGGRREG